MWQQSPADERFEVEVDGRAIRYTTRAYAANRPEGARY